MNWLIAFQLIFTMALVVLGYVSVRYTLRSCKGNDVPSAVYKRLILQRKKIHQECDSLTEIMQHKDWLKEVKALKFRERRLKEI